jgi:hypothetical protein
MYVYGLVIGLWNITFMCVDGESLRRETMVMHNVPIERCVLPDTKLLFLGFSFFPNSKSVRGKGCVEPVQKLRQNDRQTISLKISPV